MAKEPMKLFKRILLLIVLLSLLVPGLLYYGSLDWRRQHTAAVNALPVWSPSIDSGQFRLSVKGREFRIRSGGLTNSGDAVILLHGFPESSIMWQELIDAGSTQDLRMLAFDQRGYSPGARPDGVHEYSLDKLTQDVLDVADAVGFDRFHLVGHDWGSGVGWSTVATTPDRVISWTGLSIPQIGLFFDAVINDPEQKKRSAYFDTLRRPVVPEFFATYRGQKNLKSMLARLPQHHREEYLALLGEPGALSAALNWYRAMDVQGLGQDPILNKKIHTPTLYVVGKQDLVVAPSVIAKHSQRFEGPYEELILDSGHSLMQQSGETVIPKILAHIDRFQSTPGSTTEYPSEVAQ